MYYSGVCATVHDSNRLSSAWQGLLLQACLTVARCQKLVWQGLLVKTCSGVGSLLQLGNVCLCMLVKPCLLVIRGPQHGFTPVHEQCNDCSLTALMASGAGQTHISVGSAELACCCVAGTDSDASGSGRLEVNMPVSGAGTLQVCPGNPEGSGVSRKQAGAQKPARSPKIGVSPKIGAKRKSLEVAGSPEHGCKKNCVEL